MRPAPEKVGNTMNITVRITKPFAVMPVVVTKPACETKPKEPKEPKEPKKEIKNKTKKTQTKAKVNRRKTSPKKSKK